MGSGLKLGLGLWLGAGTKTGTVFKDLVVGGGGEGNKDEAWEWDNQTPLTTHSCCHDCLATRR